MPLGSGTRLGPYEIVSAIGAGGMGEVYRARDTKLGRDVALKVIPDTFALDPDRLARFKREAQVLASLNHPHIAAIYGFEDSGETHALVLELVEGETLAERLAQGSRLKAQGLPLEEALPIARQICEALEAAHEQGIIHRDLKPANIKITPEGVVKVLDFGLAKAATGDGSRSDLSQSPTITVGGTREGTILGTAAYMSPEQARGQAVDKRTDIWAFGCVLYEMLTGRAAFGRGTVTDTLAAIVERDPEWTALPPATPPMVARLLRRCLEKDARRRLHDIADARIDLDDAPAQPGPSTRGTGRVPRVWIGGAMFAAAAISASAVWVLATRTPPATGLPDARIERLTSDPGLTTMPALSPDGRLLAYASDRAGGKNLDIWVQQTAGGVPLRLTVDPADDRQPSFSPDGSQIVFRSERNGGGVYLVSALGGSARLIAREGRSPRFSPDGTRIAYWAGQFRGTPSRLASAAYVVSLAGGDPVRVLPDFVTAREPVWAPDGRSLLVLGRRDKTAPLAGDYDMWWVPLDTRPRARSGLLDLRDLRSAMDAEIVDVGTWTPDGVVLAQGAAIWLIPVSEADGRVRGPGKQLTLGVGSLSSPSASHDGQIVFGTPLTQRVIDRAALTGAGSTAPPARLYADGRPTAARASVTRDGSTIVFETATAGQVEIWRKNVRTGEQQLVLSQPISAGPDVQSSVNATVSPDGSRIGYTAPSSQRQAQTAEGTGFVVDVDGGVPRKVCEGCGIYEFLSDNRRVVVTVADQRIAALDVVAGTQDNAIIGQPDERLDRPSVSPDDRWVAFRRTRGTSAKVFVAPMTPGRPLRAAMATQVDEPTTTGRPCGWSPDSRVLYLLLDSDGFRDIWGQRVDPASGRLIGKPIVVRHFHDVLGLSTSLGNAVTAEGFVYETNAITGNIWRLLTPPASRN